MLSAAGSSASDSMRGSGAPGSAAAVEQDRAAAAGERALHVVLDAVADHHRGRRRDVEPREHGLEHPRRRLHGAGLGARHGRVHVLVQREVSDDLLEAVAERVREQRHAHSGGAQRAQARQHVVIEAEVLGPRPGADDRGGGLLDRVGGAAAQPLDDRVGDDRQQAVVVDQPRALAPLAGRRVGGTLRLRPAPRVETQPEPRAGAHVPRRLELIAGAQQRVVQVEHDQFRGGQREREG